MTEAETIADLARRSADAQVITTADGRELLILPDGAKHLDVSDPRGQIAAMPRRIEQAVTLQTVDSLVDYVKRFSGENTLLFADIAHNRIVAPIDYHGPAAPATVEHVASLALPYSEEWRVWTGAHGKLVSQLEFARFLEENAADVATPSGADLLEVCRDLHAVRKVDFRKAVRTATDHENFEYSEETEARSKQGGVEVPSKFQLSLPVYFGGAQTELQAFLRWKMEEGKLALGVSLHRSEHVRQAVFRQIVLDAAERTGRAAVFGAFA